MSIGIFFSFFPLTGWFILPLIMLLGPKIKALQGLYNRISTTNILFWWLLVYTIIYIVAIVIVSIYEGLLISVFTPVALLLIFMLFALRIKALQGLYSIKILGLNFLWLLYFIFLISGLIIFFRFE